MRNLVALLSIAALVAAAAFSPSAARAKKDPEAVAQAKLRKAAARETKKILKSATKRIRALTRAAAKDIKAVAKAVKKGKGLPAIVPGKIAVEDPSISQDEGDRIAEFLAATKAGLHRDFAFEFVVTVDELRDAPNAGQLLFDATQPDGQLGAGELLDDVRFVLSDTYEGELRGPVAKSIELLQAEMDAEGRPLHVLSLPFSELAHLGSISTVTQTYVQPFAADVISHAGEVRVVVVGAPTEVGSEFGVQLVDLDRLVIDSQEIETQTVTDVLTFDDVGTELVRVQIGPRIGDVVIPASDVPLHVATSTVTTTLDESFLSLTLDGSPIQNLELESAVVTTSGGRLNNVFVQVVDASSRDDVFVLDLRNPSGVQVFPDSPLQFLHPATAQSDHTLFVNVYPNGSSTEPILVSPGAAPSTLTVTFEDDPSDGPAGFTLEGLLLMNQSGGPDNREVEITMAVSKDDTRDQL
jgi:hypothetical protein